VAVIESLNKEEIKSMTLYQVTQSTDNGNGDTVGTLSYAILQANRNEGVDQN
jgi:hypothetical protein